MDYFICASTSPYDQWQLELLIESFKKINIENNLLVCLTEEANSLKKFISNISNHKRIYRIKNSYEYKSINRIQALTTFVKNKLIQQPFLMITEPDLVIKKEINLVGVKDVIDFLYSNDPFFTLEKAESECGNFWDEFNLNKDECKEKWICLGDIVAFNNFSDEFFEKLLFNVEKLAVIQISNQNKVWEGTMKLALVISLLEISPKVRLSKIDNLVIPAISIGDSNFISYKKGIPPDFHKLMFTYEPPNYLCLGDPLETLSNIYNLPNTKYISDLAKNVLELNS